MKHPPSPTRVTSASRPANAAKRRTLARAWMGCAAFFAAPAWAQAPAGLAPAAQTAAAAAPVVRVPSLQVTEVMTGAPLLKRCSRGPCQMPPAVPLAAAPAAWNAGFTVSVQRVPAASTSLKSKAQLRSFNQRALPAGVPPSQANV